MNIVKCRTLVVLVCFAVSGFFVANVLATARPDKATVTVPTVPTTVPTTVPRCRPSCPRCPRVVSTVVSTVSTAVPTVVSTSVDRRADGVDDRAECGAVGPHRDG